MTKNLRSLLTLLLTVSLIISAVIFSLGTKKSAFADEQSSAIETQLFMPKTELEYKELNSPIDAYSDDNVTAIIENSQDYHVITVVTKNGYYDTSANSDKGNLLGVRKFNDQNLLYANAGDLFALDVSTFASTEITFDNKKGVSIFDIAGEYLVTALNTEMALYKIDEDLSARFVLSKTIQDKSPVAITAIEDDVVIFMVCKDSVDGKFYLSKLSKNALAELPQKLAPVSPSHMIANNEFVYYLDNGSVYRISVNGGQPQLLTVETNDAYDLGNIVTPSGLSFKGNNLLLTDTTLNAIQEFEIVGDKLVFTGYAITKDKTAYNRISDTVLEIEKYGDTVATLDANKLSIINAGKDFDAYDKDSYKDYFKADLGGEMPNAFALGNGTALLSFIKEQETNFASLKLLNLNSGELLDVSGFESTTFIDLTYQSGYYYVLASKGTSYKIYKAQENDQTFTFTETAIPVTLNSKMIAVDVFNNVYVVDNVNHKISKYAVSGGKAIAQYSFQDNIKKITTDLGGGIFALKDSSILHLDKNGSWQDLAISPSAINKSAILKSFAMDFISKDVYFIYDNEEFVYKTTNLNNFAISALNVPDTYVTTANNADFDAFKAYKPTDNANVYSIDKTDSEFIYKELVSEREQYALITEVLQTDAFGRELKLFALAGQDHVTLINQTECVAVDVNAKDAPEKAFITTAVHAYYMPILTDDDGYSLTDADNKIRLAKNTEIAPIKSFDFLDLSYYFASVTVEDVTYYGYIPKNFTVEVLSVDLVWDSYTVKTVKQTEVFAEQDLTTSLATLENGQKVRVIEKIGSVYKVSYQLENKGDWLVGYIESSSIQDKSNVAIRNILIILAVTACVCGTTSYFLLRRKKQ